eukprot:Rmarinus@m.4990
MWAGVVTSTDLGNLIEAELKNETSRSLSMSTLFSRISTKAPSYKAVVKGKPAAFIKKNFAHKFAVRGDVVHLSGKMEKQDSGISRPAQVESSASLDSICKRILTAANSQSPPTLCIVLEGPLPGDLRSVQLCFSGTTYAVDVSKVGLESTNHRLSVLFGSNGVLKVLHNLNACLPALRSQLGLGSDIQCQQVLDVQLLCDSAFEDSCDVTFEESIDLLWNLIGEDCVPPPKTPESLPVIQLYDVISKVLPRLSDAAEVVSASCRRANLISETGGRPAIGIDKSDYSIRSLELLETYHPNDALKFFAEEDSAGMQEALALLPPRYLVKALSEDVIDIALDSGYQPRAVTRAGCVQRLLQEEQDRTSADDASSPIVDCDPVYVTPEDIRDVVERVGGAGAFSSNHRAALQGSLHRISAVLNRTGEIIGLTIRIGRALLGAAHPLADVICGMKEKSVLFLGAPGSGKTTLLRDASRMLSQQLQQNVWIVDTSNEIAGDGDVPHRCIGQARRMMVPNLDAQARTMVEVVQNHMPKVMIVDEIGRPAEVEAADTVKKRGVRMIATAHGDFRGLSSNPQLKKLLGARVDSILKGGTPVTTRVSKPIFDVVIVLHSDDLFVWDIIADAGKAVDSILRGKLVSATRRRLQNGILTVETINF